MTVDNYTKAGSRYGDGPITVFPSNIKKENYKGYNNYNKFRVADKNKTQKNNIIKCILFGGAKLKVAVTKNVSKYLNFPFNALRTFGRVVVPSHMEKKLQEV